MTYELEVYALGGGKPVKWGTMALDTPNHDIAGRAVARARASVFQEALDGWSLEAADRATFEVRLVGNGDLIEFPEGKHRAVAR